MWNHNIKVKFSLTIFIQGVYSEACSFALEGGDLLKIKRLFLVMVLAVPAGLIETAQAIAASWAS